MRSAYPRHLSTATMDNNHCFVVLTNLFENLDICHGFVARRLPSGSDSGFFSKYNLVGRFWFSLLQDIDGFPSINSAKKSVLHSLQ
jgi:hypothetical protein